jgi:FkbM family methyltransferase
MPTIRGAFRLLSLVNRAVQGDLVARRRLAWRFLAGNASALAFDREGIHWAGPMSSVIVEELFTNGQYQQQQIRPLRQWIERNCRAWSSSSVVVNVGANIGDSAIVLAIETGKRVLACEPVPITFAFLEQNVRANHLEGRVLCRQVAIGTQTGTIEMVSPGDSARAEVVSGSTQGFSVAGGDAVARTQALMTTLDALLQADAISVHQVGLVWSDTQGYESEIVASGSMLWKTGVPLWVEFWPDGLDAHGGVSRFVDLCQQHFKSFIKGGEISLPQPEAHDVKTLGDFSELVRRELPRFQDVLLIP